MLAVDALLQLRAWLADGWLPRTPNSLEALDLLLVMVAKLRVVRRDGIRFRPTQALHVYPEDLNDQRDSASDGSEDDR